MCDGRCGLAIVSTDQVSAGGEVACDAGLDRRAFLTRSTLAAVAAVLASACGDGIIGGQSPTGLTQLPASGLPFKVSDYPALGQVGGIVPARAASMASSPKRFRTSDSRYGARVNSLPPSIPRL